MGQDERSHADSGDGDSSSVSTDELEWTTVDSEVAYSCPGFEVVSQTVELPDGTRTDFDYLSEPPAVVILPVTPQQDVVVIDEWRQAVERVNRGIPAGTVEPTDDDLATAARRELREETGYEAGTIDSLLTVEPTNGVADSVHHYFLARDCTPTEGQQLDSDESISVSTTSMAELRQAVLDGDVRDGRLVTAVTYWSLVD
jgi:ADP-ribose pyrophosphatase